MDKTKTTFIIVGRTTEGFLKFLKKNKLNTIEPELLADYIIKGIINYEKTDRDASNRTINEIWDIVGVKEPDIAAKVTREFGKLCHMYRSAARALKNT